MVPATSPLAAAIPTSESAGARWQAVLDLGFSAIGSKTHLSRNRHFGPLVVQRPFSEANGTCQAVILNPPGGVVAGDHLRLNVEVGAGAHALVTTPGATKFYRSSGATGFLEQHFHVAEAGCLEWLPHETIAYDRTKARMLTRIELAAGARFAGWELTCLGRPACGERFDGGNFTSSFELWQGRRPLWLERSRIEPTSPVRDAAWGLAGQPVSGSCVWFPAGAEQLAVAREQLAQADAVNASTGLGSVDRQAATLVGQVLVCRYLGGSTLRARRAFQMVWSALRQPLLGKLATPPRIWST
jgi:urease accessory protein